MHEIIHLMIHLVSYTIFIALVFNFIGKAKVVAEIKADIMNIKDKLAEVHHRVDQLDENMQSKSEEITDHITDVKEKVEIAANSVKTMG